MNLQFMQLMTESRRTNQLPLTKSSKESKPSIASRIPVSQKCKNKPLFKNEDKDISSTQKVVPVKGREFRSNMNGLSRNLSNICAPRKDCGAKMTGFVDKRDVNSDVFVWKTEKGEEKTLEKNKEDMLLWMTQVPSATPPEARQEEMFRKSKGKIRRENEITRNGNDFGAECMNASCRETCLNIDHGNNSTHIEVKKMEKRDVDQVMSKYESSTLCTSKLFYSLVSDNAIYGSSTFETECIPSSHGQPNDNIFLPKEAERSLRDTNELEDRCGHKYDSRGHKEDRRGHKEGGSGHKEGGSGHKEDRSGHESERDRNVRQGIVRTHSKSSPHKSDLKNEIERERDDNTKLRAQIEKLSSFVESSEDLRERSEMLLTQQKKELEKEIHEKEILKNKVCCLEELRRNLQRKLDVEMEENKSLKKNIKNTEGKLADEREKIKIIKKECSSELLKNTELELVLQTVLEELGSANKLLNMKSTEDKKVAWDEITVPGHVGTMNRYPKYSVDYYKRSSEENWKREKCQFKGKIKLLEMDKKNLRSQIGLLEEKIVEHERIGCNLRENNDVLEFRITELEYQVLELTREK